MASATLGFSSLPFQLGGFLKKVSTRRDSWGKQVVTLRSIPICLAVNDPNAPLPAQFRIGRTKKSKDYFLLETEGLLDTTVKFTIADRKSLGIKNKSCQLSLFYKIARMNHRATLNNLIAGGFNIPSDPQNSLGLINLKQTYEIEVDGQPFEISLSQGEIFSNIDGQSPNGTRYLRLLLYKVFERYNEFRSVTDPGYRTPVQINTSNIVNSRGLFAERPVENIFSNQPVTVSSVLAENPLNEIDSVGRSAPIVEPEVVIPPTQAETPPESFTGFTKLPLALKVLQRGSIFLPSGNNLQGLNTPLLSANLLNSEGQINQSALDALTEGQRNDGNGRLRIDSLDNMFLSFEQFCYAFENLDPGSEGQPGEPVGVHTVKILSRRTDYSVVKDSTNPQIVANFQPNSIFSFFKNHLNYDRTYINAAY